MHCKICQGPTEAFFDTYMKCETYHCHECEFIFKEEAAIISNEKELKVYEQHNNTEENLGYVAMFQDFMEKTFLPYKKEIHTVLDFGSGPNPVLANIMTHQGFQVDHYDKFFAPEKVYVDKKYDLITSTEVIEHISEVQETMALFSEHLQEGGYLALMTQFHPNEKEAYLKWWYRRDPTHISFFRPHALQTLAQQHHFQYISGDEKKIILFQKRAAL